ncbi:MAG: UDP-2,3-diacylglucosamine diphosphatase [Candidatus Eisenbacteria bacterium]|uniref:UDP-2,3-diacylglucosamine diphosphatase n=1 Tax=Eiseniibacteriota bacterium TaxID=2212470 RepID=A0A948RVK8_UNCEI|nr:UDP-2,3-diacylglucosamine diphosphatase [Candidatus Eisenbacteria bacterium]MBU1947296.1 UDP-2,3-diacylglucosamine diphosphatase [Candidatus Eisenbacteria bacterium]MBU2691835.1 UDP-2,3-diacylglucosamine diphosphatase [Candidatus Eisenbacteria bacterium]
MTHQSRTEGSSKPVRSNGIALFLSDLHLGVASDVPERVAWLLDLLHQARHRVSEVYLLGDLFDFWFEYHRAIPKGYFHFLRALSALVDEGIPVTYLGGNHDFWVGPYLERELGIEVFDRPVERQIQGRRIFLAHGDGLARGDNLYRVLNKILKNRFCIALYRLLHPDLGIPFAHWVSNISRRHKLVREILLPRLYQDIALPRFEAGYDAVVMGHVHAPAHIRRKDPLGEKEYIILGDWIKNFTYMEMEGGRFRLMRWNPQGESRLCAPESPPIKTPTRA